MQWCATEMLLDVHSVQAALQGCTQSRIVMLTADAALTHCRVALLFAAWRATAARQAAVRWAAQQVALQTTVGRVQRVMMMWRWWAARQRYLRQVG